MAIQASSGMTVIVVLTLEFIGTVTKNSTPAWRLAAIAFAA